MRQPRPSRPRSRRSRRCARRPRPRCRPTPEWQAAKATTRRSRCRRHRGGEEGRGVGGRARRQEEALRRRSAVRLSLAAPLRNVRLQRRQHRARHRSHGRGFHRLQRCAAQLRGADRDPAAAQRACDGQARQRQPSRRPRLSDIERRAMLEVGIDAKEKVLSRGAPQAGRRRRHRGQEAGLLRKLDETRKALVAGDTNPAYNEALETIAAADSKDDLATLYSEARRTPTTADEAIVRGLETIDAKIAKAEAEIAGPAPHGTGAFAPPARGRAGARPFPHDRLRSSASHLRATTAPSPTRSRIFSRAPSEAACCGISCARATDPDPHVAVQTSALPVFPFLFPAPAARQPARPVETGGTRLVAAPGSRVEGQLVALVQTTRTSPRGAPFDVERSLEIP